MYTKIQKQIIEHTKQKVSRLFKSNPVPAHSFDHVSRVYNWAVKIAKAEKTDVFLCALSALLHDIGRTLESPSDGRRHHELSYELGRKWFREDRIYDNLTRPEKIIVLYAIRYHWNNAADKYPEAVILRDADKLDLFGAVGVRRQIEWRRTTPQKLYLDMRLRYDNYYWVITETARRFLKKYKMIEPIDRFCFKWLKRHIKPIEL